MTDDRQCETTIYDNKWKEIITYTRYVIDNDRRQITTDDRLQLKTNDWQMLMSSLNWEPHWLTHHLPFWTSSSFYELQLTSINLYQLISITANIYQHQSTSVNFGQLWSTSVYKKGILEGFTLVRQLESRWEGWWVWSICLILRIAWANYKHLFPI